MQKQGLLLDLSPANQGFYNNTNIGICVTQSLQIASLGLILVTIFGHCMVPLGYDNEQGPKGLMLHDMPNYYYFHHELPSNIRCPLFTIWQWNWHHSKTKHNIKRSSWIPVCRNLHTSNYTWVKIVCIIFFKKNISVLWSE